jgi:NAD(P)-dependent dehydrogenase (short-subunit alcohol dehydrogenase family)
MSQSASETDNQITSVDLQRRRFLQYGVLVSAGASATMGVLNPKTAIAAEPVAASTVGSEPSGKAPGSCSAVKTPMKDVAGKVAFITGGDSGIGLGMARAFASAGMKVVITYRTKTHLDEALEYLKDAAGRVRAINVDVTDRQGMEQAAEETVKTFGKVHLLVNNAGVAVGVPLSKATFEDWDWGIGVNLNGVFNGVHAFLPRLQAHGEGGQIVTTSSMGGLLGIAGNGIYSTSKFAVVGMMESLRFELADANIGVSVYCPGGVKSNVLDDSRNRPRSLANSGASPPPAAALAQFQKLLESAGMDALEAGELVLHGIRNNDLYILTHPEFEREMRERHEALMASIPRGVVVPQARIDLERMVSTWGLYVVERDHRLCDLSPNPRA